MSYAQRSTRTELLAAGVVALLVASSACGLFDPGRTVTVRGAVSVDGLPAAGWAVHVIGWVGDEGYETFAPVLVDSTDAEGDFEISLRTCEELMLTDSTLDTIGRVGIIHPASGHYPSADLCAARGAYDFLLERPAASIYGYARSWGAPLVGATVTLAGLDNRVATVDGEGEFSADSVRWGAYTITISDYGAGVAITPAERVTPASCTAGGPMKQGSSGTRHV